MSCKKTIVNESVRNDADKKSNKGKYFTEDIKVPGKVWLLKML